MLTSVDKCIARPVHASMSIEHKMIPHAKHTNEVIRWVRIKHLTHFGASLCGGFCCTTTCKQINEVDYELMYEYLCTTHLYKKN